MNKKIIQNIGAAFLTVSVIGAAIYELKFKANEYDTLIWQAYKRKEDFPHLNVFDGVYEVFIPDSKLNSEGNGVDSDNNGIRDDVDIWINRMSNSFNERMAMRQYAKIQHDRMKNCNNSIGEINKAVLCLEMISYYERNGKSFGVPKLDVLIPNTDSRLKCYFPAKISFNKLVTEQLLKENCQFEVKDVKGIIEVSEYYNKTL